ncbi:hypothetical protein OKW41_007426 [Paraburkholderia sp. UCT70]
MVPWRGAAFALVDFMRGEYSRPHYASDISVMTLDQLA